MKTIENRPVLIICSGYSIKKYKKKIQSYIKKKSPIIIGVNHMSFMFIPDLHLWTNKKRYAAYGHTIKESSTPIFSSKLPISLIRKHWGKPYKTIEYSDNSSEITSYNNGVIKGWFRTSGILAIMIAHVYKASSIEVVGMDGYTLHSRTDYLAKKQNHHCYGAGKTETSTWKKTVFRDGEMNRCLKRLQQYGVKFSIMTPTKFQNFYDQGKGLGI